MANVEQTKNRLEQLIEKGKRVLESESKNWVDGALFQGWAAGCEAFLSQVFGGESSYLAHFKGSCRANYANHAQQGQAVLKATLDELESGPLSKLEDLVSGEIFTDFLTMAEHLLKQGYKDPAASLTGAVLEDGLRRLAKKNDIKVRDRDDISSLNARIADGQVYNRVVQSEVEAWNRVRNQADHGKFSQYDRGNVDRMLDGVRSFLAKFL